MGGRRWRETAKRHNRDGPHSYFSFGFAKNPAAKKGDPVNSQRDGNGTSTPPRPRGKSGPMGFQPSSDDRLRVELGIASGSSVVELARVFGLPRTTFRRAFTDEIKAGRTRVRLELSMHLYKAAMVDQSVAAAKTLLGIIERADKRAPVAPARNPWAYILDPAKDGTPNSARNRKLEN